MDMQLFLAAFVGYIICMIWLGWFVSRNQKSGEDFLLGGRELPLMLTLGTTVATMVGTGSSMGAVGFAYQNGWAGTLYGIGGAIGILLLAWLYAPLRKLRFMTMSEEISYYVGANVLVKNVIAVIIFIASIGWLGAHIIGGGMYLAWIAEIDQNLAKLLIATGFAIYVIIGGYTAVVWTDSVQAIILFLGFILMSFFAVDYVGGWSAMIDAQPADSFSLTSAGNLGIVPAISLALVVMIGVLATPSFRQRIYSGKDIPSIRKAFMLSGGLYLLFSFIPAVIGMTTYAINAGLENPSFAFPYLAIEVLPLGLGMIILIAGISATMSSASSDAIAAVTVVLRDLFVMTTGKMPEARSAITFSRISLFVIISVALLFAMTSNDIISYITKMIAMLMSGMFVCGVLGRFWPRFNWQGAIAALVSASGTSFVVILSDDWSSYWGNPIIPSLMVSISMGVIVSKLTPACQVSPAQALAILEKERAEMEGGGTESPAEIDQKSQKEVIA